ncbi:MAG: metallophosphoesterase [Verrucomicrobiota bacterium]
MPIHLPPLSRRQFLGRTLVAGAGLLLQTNLFAASRRIDESRWALISDTHIAEDPEKIARDTNMTRNLAAVVDEVTSLKKLPGAALVSGDLAFNQGEKGDYGNFIGLIEPLRRAKMPVHLALGNHDQRENFWDALAQEKSAPRPVADRQVAMIQSSRANWFVLDSLDKTLSTPGVLGSAQLAWLAKALDANARKPALVVVHHNPNLDGTSKGALVDTRELFEIIRPRKQVKAHFFGHSHSWSVSEDASGVHLINLPPTAYPFDKAKPNGWVLADLEKRGMRLELRCLDRSHSEHGRVVNLKWRT